MRPLSCGNCRDVRIGWGPDGTVATAVRVAIVSVCRVCLSSTTTALAVTAFKPRRAGFDAAFPKKRCAKAARDAVNSGNALAALKQNQAQIAFRDVVVGLDGLAQKIVHFRDYSTPENPPPPHERKETLAAFGIGFRFRFLQHADELIAQIKCVAQILNGLACSRMPGIFEWSSRVPMAMTR